MAFEGFLASLLQDGMWPPESNANRATALQAKILEDFAMLLADAEPVEGPSRNVRQSVSVHHARRARAPDIPIETRGVPVLEVQRAV